MPTRPAYGNSTEVFLVDALPAGEAHVGEAGSPADVVYVTPTLDTSAYTAGDVLFDTAAVAGALRVSGGKAKLVSVTVLDEDDQAAATLDLYFFRSNVSLGTVNGAPNVSDANARECLGWVPVAVADWKDVGTSKIACVRNVNLMLKATTGTTVYVAGVTGGTPTQTAAGIRIALGLEQY
jgi:hypothetical protein